MKFFSNFYLSTTGSWKNRESIIKIKKASLFPWIRPSFAKEWSWNFWRLNMKRPHGGPMRPSEVWKLLENIKNISVQTIHDARIEFLPRLTAGAENPMWHLIACGGLCTLYYFINVALFNYPKITFFSKIWARCFDKILQVF